MNGREYFFLSPRKFARLERRDKFLETAEFVGYRYGTPRRFIDKLRAKGHNVLLEIEVVGAIQVMEKVPEALSLFLTPPNYKELERRLRQRGTEEEDKIAMRMEKARKEISQSKLYQHVIKNGEPLKAADQIDRIITEATNSLNNI
ncbi:unnamed protein product [Didymodactylos carnosus]|uniref:Guanylate kinase-like domain-containing protein n=1 Tax=Didymodactylos carnosus TaxID=1234261 RepID=A0A8S2FRN9_9BILA|nr:unnamed protein product [Didymodactylos carnosus]CAF4316877.1 unnamed protein product [Didymodactylos carnosus]